MNQWQLVITNTQKKENKKISPVLMSDPYLGTVVRTISIHHSPILTGTNKQTEGSCTPY